MAAKAEDGVVRGYLKVALLPRDYSASPPPLLEADASYIAEYSLAPVQLLEGQEYLYEWEGIPAEIDRVTTDPEEAFQPDTADGFRGRLRPGLSTGTLQVCLRTGEQELGQLELEVRSRKLHYLSEYRWMLRDIADQMTELVMDRFAVSGASFAPEGTRDAVTLYQRFAFLRALLTSETFRNALAQITRSPHVAWEETHEAIRPGQSIRASAKTLRQLTRPGERIRWRDGPLASIPIRLDRQRTAATHDTTPNRFVKFALERWRQVIADIGNGLDAAGSNAAVTRGRREVRKTLEQLDFLLDHDLFKDLGPLGRFPADDQVLQRREGYREIFRAYLEFELAAQLSWQSAESRFTAGQHDVATLYEHWAFLQLAQLIANLAGQSFDLRNLVELRPDALNVVLQSGKETVLSGTAERLGRRMAIELCFNRTFSQGSGFLGSWTRPMRPDYSLIISAPVDEPAVFEPVVLHFDAKYRVNFLDELFGGKDELVNRDAEALSGVEAKRGSVLRADLLKMHAYRDAIRRSAGAYVLYPGDENTMDGTQFREYQELLPGLGAFVLRPSPTGDAVGIGTLRTFLDSVLAHVATRLTRHERGRYWLEEAYGLYEAMPIGPALAIPTVPGPETTVLLGYVKSEAHWQWIHKVKAYNVRTKGRAGGVDIDAELLYCQLLLLYCPELNDVRLTRIVSGPELIQKTAILSTGYPNPTSDYLCVQLSWVQSQECVAAFCAEQIDRLVQGMGRLKGEPTAVRWADLQQQSQA
jgi:predicted component of viral defense system (DUF524 family)